MGGRHAPDRATSIARVASPVDRLAPEAKLLALLAYVGAVVLTPRTAIWAFGLHAVVVALAVGAARLTPATVLRRLAIEVPFVAFAVALPVVGGAPRTAIGPWTASVPGLWAAWSILARGTLGVAAASILAATTGPADLVVGLQRLRVPAPIVAVLSFFVRYLDVVADDLGRTSVARAARGGGDRWLWQARGVAAGAGAVFVRTYERGERVHLAMRARGFDGHLPDVAAALEALDPADPATGNPVGAEPTATAANPTATGRRTARRPSATARTLLAALPAASVATAVVALVLR